MAFAAMFIATIVIVIILYDGKYRFCKSPQDKGSY